MSMRKILFSIFLIPMIFSCTTLQQDINIEQVSYSEEVVSFEQRFASINSSVLFSGNADSEIEKIEIFLADIEEALGDQSVQKSARARLYALKGRALLISGKKAKAKECFEAAATEYKGDTEAVILSYHLGVLQINDIEEKLLEVPEKPLIILEKAVDLYKSRKYTDSVAKFDEAFLSLDSFYHEAYKKLRDSAWNLRNVDSDSDSAELMMLPEISVSQMLSIAREKSDFLYNLIGGKKMSDKNSFNKAAALGLFNSVSKPLEPSDSVGADNVVTKYFSARFLWNLYNMMKNTTDSANKYSSRLKRSPVTDLSVDSPDFDAVLGCVEKEIMSLEDGRNFDGERNVSAIEFDGFMDKIKN